MPNTLIILDTSIFGWTTILQGLKHSFLNYIVWNGLKLCVRTMKSPINVKWVSFSPIYFRKGKNIFNKTSKFFWVLVRAIFSYFQEFRKLVIYLLSRLVVLPIFLLLLLGIWFGCLFQAIVFYACFYLFSETCKIEY